MPMRDTDSRLIQCATRLKLSWTRDHLLELINTVTDAKMTPREVLDYCFSKEIEQPELPGVPSTQISSELDAQITL